MPDKKRVLSGMRPTGRLHLGHLVGALDNWIKLQDEYQCFFFVADWHALTTDYADTSRLVENTFQMTVDWLAAGLDPSKATFFLQSRVPAHAELHLLFSMVTPLGWLERVPSYKEQRDNIRDKDLGNYGFLGYPVLQAADILIYRAHFVPVGEDQVAHVELTREICRRFNNFYGLEIDQALRQPDKFRAARAILDRGGWPPGLGREWPEGARGQEPLNDTAWRIFTAHLRSVAAEQGTENFLHGLGVLHRYFNFRPKLIEPAALLTEASRLPGLDGRKMSKSYGNVIQLSDEPDVISQKVRGMLTDPQRMRRTDPGRPEICPVFSYHQRYSPKDVVAQIDKDCRTAQIGCVDCKQQMTSHLLPVLEPIRERRRLYESKPGQVWEILAEGSARARAEAGQTMQAVREAMQMVFPVLDETNETNETEPSSASSGAGSKP